MSDEIMIDVCMAPTDDERQQLIALSKLYWENDGYELISDKLGPDKITVTEGKIAVKPPNKIYLPNTQYAKRRRDGAAVVLFVKK